MLSTLMPAGADEGDSWFSEELDKTFGNKFLLENNTTLQRENLTSPKVGLKMSLKLGAGSRFSGARKMEMSLFILPYSQKAML